MNILYSKEERPRAGVVIHDCILALGRLVKSRKKKQTRNSRPSLATQQVQGSVGYTRLCLKSYPFALDLVLLHRQSVPLFLDLPRHKSQHF